MKTIQIDDNNEQSRALINYLKSLPFVQLMEDSIEETKLEPDEITDEKIESEDLVSEAIQPAEIEIASPMHEESVEEKSESEKISIATSPNHGIFSEILEKRLLTDLRKALSFNDKFRFKKDLFNGSQDEMNEVLGQLNSFTSFSEAWNYIESIYQWNPENDSVTEFRHLLEKRYS